MRFPPNLYIQSTGCLWRHNNWLIGQKYNIRGYMNTEFKIYTLHNDRKSYNYLYM